MLAHAMVAHLRGVLGDPPPLWPDHNYSAPDTIGTGYCFRSISLFLVCLFLCQQDYEKTAGPICMKFSGKVWSDHGTT